MLALYGLKWNPFAPDVPVEALHVTRRIESFCWRVQQLVGEGGFALVTGAPGTGKSVALRILAERLGAQRDVRIGIVTRRPARSGCRPPQPRRDRRQLAAAPAHPRSVRTSPPHRRERQRRGRPAARLPARAAAPA